MQSAPQTFINIIRQISTAYGLDLSLPWGHLRLEQDNYLPLVIEKLDLHQISVTHYYRQNGDAMADPDISFLIKEFEEHQLWIPIEITQASVGVYRRATWLNSHGEVEKFSLSEQKKIAKFCSLWAKNLKAQEWHQRGKPAPNVRPISSTFTPKSLFNQES